MDARSSEESVYLYIAHIVESLYRVFVAARHVDTSVVSLHACSSNFRPVAALTFFHFQPNCCFFQCLPPVYPQSEYTSTCMPTHPHTAARAALAVRHCTRAAMTAPHVFDIGLAICLFFNCSSLMVREKSLFDAFSVTKCQITCCVEAFRFCGAGWLVLVELCR